MYIAQFDTNGILTALYIVNVNILKALSSERGRSILYL